MRARSFATTAPSASALPWYREQIASFVATMDATTVTDADYDRLARLPQADALMQFEVQAHSNSTQHIGSYLPAARKKQIEALWAKTLNVLDQLEEAPAKADAYTAAFQALASAGAPAKYMEHLLQRMQAEKLPANPTVHIAMLHAARDRGILQVLRRVKAAQLGGLLLDAEPDALTPRQVQNLHYRAHASFVKSLFGHFMSSNTATFALETYGELLREIHELLPPLDPMLMERTVPDEYMDKLAVVSVRALAMAGRHADVLARLAELETQYSGRSAKVPALVYEAALEGLSASYHNLTLISERQLVQRNKGADVQAAPRVQDIRSVQSKLSAKLAATVDHMETEMAALPWAAVETKYAEAKATKDYLEFVRARARGASVLESYRLLTAEAVAAGDAFVDAVAGRFAAQYSAPSLAMELGQLKQYFVASSRYERRLKRSQQLADELVARILASVDRIGAQRAAFPEADVVECLHYAFRGLALLHRGTEARAILNLKTTWFPHTAWTVAEYDDMLMLLCKTKSTRWSDVFALLQDMHNRGMAPSPLTMHRLVTYRMLRLTKGTPEEHVVNTQTAAYARALEEAIATGNVTLVTDEDEDDEDEAVAEKPTWDDADTVGDVITFLQDWVNMTGVVPYGKTVVPLAEYCAMKGALSHELSRLLLWLETLPLDPATKAVLRGLKP
ncbi:hypothetical protein ACHHYP_14432 [Achlya hypogyna]|uniref:Uncharacterized protein n=1 Tax=Achlya hypogyna TaxID=1202772 RepID=A0A1V9YD70_ACHHY|nr:hypothetical protein ACHHYP_14432 [Achlya hypogyna]